MIKYQFDQRYMEIRSVYTQFESDGVICATKPCSNVSTTFAVDNIDHNPSSRCIKDSWDGTANFSTNTSNQRHMG